MLTESHISAPTDYGLLLDPHCGWLRAQRVSTHASGTYRLQAVNHPASCSFGRAGHRLHSSKRTSPLVRRRKHSSPLDSTSTKPTLEFASFSYSKPAHQSSISFALLLEYTLLPTDQAFCCDCTDFWRRKSPPTSMFVDYHHLKGVSFTNYIASSTKTTFEFASFGYSNRHINQASHLQCGLDIHCCQLIEPITATVRTFSAEYSSSSASCQVPPSQNGFFHYLYNNLTAAGTQRSSRYLACFQYSIQHPV